MVPEWKRSRSLYALDATVDGHPGGGAWLLSWEHMFEHELLLLFVRRGGLFFGLAALLRHQLYYLYSAAVFVFAKLEGILLGGARQPDA